MVTVAWCTLAALLLLTARAVAAPPPNDDFADAAEMSGWPAEATGSTIDATSEPGDPTGDPSIWFKWTALKDGGIGVFFDGCAPPFQDSHPAGLTFAAYRWSAVFGLVRVEQTFHAEAGQVYWIMVASLHGEPGDPDICVRLRPGPANDDFANATRLTGFPTSASQRTRSDELGSTTEPGEPNHAGSDPPPGSLWYSWRAPRRGPVVLRLCGGRTLAVYTGQDVGALTHIATRRPRSFGCGSDSGAPIAVNAIEGETYRIAVVGSSEWFQLSVGTQVAVVTPTGRPPFFSYWAFAGQADKLKLRLTGSGGNRTLLVEARGVTVANGCETAPAAGRLRCPVPGKAMFGFEIDLGDGNDTADVRLPGRGRPSQQFATPRKVRGGDGNDTLAGSAGFYRVANGWSGGLALLGGSGTDRLTGGAGQDWIYGGAGPDRIVAGAGSDRIDGGPGNERVKTLDDATDRIFCAAGRDRARLDGIDLPRGCERRKLRSPARAVPTGAILANDDGEDYDHLKIGIACPIDAKGGCRTTIAIAGTRGRSIIRRLRLAPGHFGLVRTYRLGVLGPLRHRGARVTVSTRPRGRATLKLSRRLPVSDNRYYGEG